MRVKLLLLLLCYFLQLHCKFFALSPCFKLFLCGQMTFFQLYILTVAYCFCSVDHRLIFCSYHVAYKMLTIISYFEMIGIKKSKEGKTQIGSKLHVEENKYIQNPYIHCSSIKKILGVLFHIFVHSPSHNIQISLFNFIFLHHNHTIFIRFYIFLQLLFQLNIPHLIFSSCPSVFYFEVLPLVFLVGGGFSQLLFL